MFYIRQICLNNVFLSLPYLSFWKINRPNHCSLLTADENYPENLSFGIVSDVFMQYLTLKQEIEFLYDASLCSLFMWYIHWKEAEENKNVFNAVN